MNCLNSKSKNNPPVNEKRLPGEPFVLEGFPNMKNPLGIFFRVFGSVQVHFSASDRGRRSRSGFGQGE